MAEKHFRWRLEEMLDDLSAIEAYTPSHFEILLEDSMRFDAIVRRLSKLGESTKYLPDWVLERYPDVPWNEMRSVRNFLVHDYFGIGFLSLWITLQEELPEIRDALARVLEDWKEI